MKGFTLVELVIVLIIVGILATLGIAHFGPMREKLLVKEAIAHLKIIQAAEKTTRLEQGDFVACTDTADCNIQLGLALPSADWDYVVDYNPPGDTTFNATADRLVGGWSNCQYYINVTMNITGNNGNCIYTETE